MRHFVAAVLVSILPGAIVSPTALANPPGVDPIRIKHFSQTPLRGAPAKARNPAVRGNAGSGGAAGSQARMARFSAKLMTLDSTSPDATYATNAQVRSISDDAGQLCVMDIGSATAPASGFNSFGPAGDTAQPVLIRGNIINVCK